MIESHLPAFKAYDIRGIYGHEIDNSFAYLLGRGVGRWFLDQYGHDAKFVCGCDTRPVNKELMGYFMMGMQEMGVDHIHVANFTPKRSNPEIDFPRGVCSTSYLYWIIDNTYDLGASFTASHNEASYVGMKFADKNVHLISPEILKKLYIDEYYKQIVIHLPDIEQLHFSTPDSIYERKDALHDMLDDKRKELNRPYNFAVDFCHGAGVSCEREFLSHYAAKYASVTFINDYPDGRFPIHDSETQKSQNYKQLVDDILENKRDFGIMFDGDVDRLGIVTNKGNIIPGDILTAIISRQLLIEYKKKPSNKRPLILYDVMSSKLIEDIVADHNGNAEITRVGRFFINRKIHDKNALFGGECSGHYMFGNYGGYELPLLALYYICKEAELYDDFDGMFEAYKKYFKSPVIDIDVIDKDATLAGVKHHFRNYNPHEIDGVNIFTESFHITVRKSNTSDKIRYCIEADTQELYDKLHADLSGIINLFAKHPDEEDDNEHK